MIDVIILYTLNKIRVTFSLHYVNFCFKFKLKLKMTRRGHNIQIPIYESYGTK